MSPQALRCSGFARSEDLDPVGSAGSYRGVVLVEIPLPWPREITEHPALAPAAPALEAANVRLQGLVPDGHSAPGRRRLVSFTRPAGPFDRYDGRAWTPGSTCGAPATRAATASRPPPCCCPRARCGPTSTSTASSASPTARSTSTRPSGSTAAAPASTGPRSRRPTGRACAPWVGRGSATVEVVRLVPVPDCGKPPEEAPKSAPELRVSGFAAA